MSGHIHESTNSLVVATYNIHRCIGRDGRRDPDRIVRVIQETGATLVALQEVESFYESAIAGLRLDYLSHAAGLRSLAGPTIFRRDFHYGNALLTDARVLHVSHHDLSVIDCEPRGAIDAELEIGGYSVRVIATHLGLRSWERDRQAKKLLEILPEQDTQPTLLLGDFNEWFYRRSSIRRMRKRFSKISGLRTYPSRFPVLALDRIWCSPQELLVAAKVHHTPLSSMASDHLPLIAKLDLEGF